MRPFLLLVSLSLSFSLFAQTGDFPSTCHYAPDRSPLPPLTEAQKADILASIQRSDSFDIIETNIYLDVTDFANERIEATCSMKMVPKMDNLPTLTLDLLNLRVDSVYTDTETLAHVYDNRFLEVELPALSTNDTLNFTVRYGGSPTTDPGGFGGLDFDQGYCYNLGIGLNSNPYNFGRSWFPCFDNFVERSLYNISLRSAGGRKGWAVGTFLGEDQQGGDTLVRHFALDKEIQTYLVGVAISNYTPVYGTHQGAFQAIPTVLIAKTPDTSLVRRSFAALGASIDALEYWYGPYIWDKVGYVMTVRGAMEHAGLVAYPANVGLGGEDFDQNRLMAHELAHHWWGNIVTMDGPDNMWLKEGNAEYAAHLFTEWYEGRQNFNSQVRSNLSNVLRRAHVNDGSFLPLRIPMNGPTEHIPITKEQWCSTI